MDSRSRLDCWESRTELPLAGIATAFLVDYSVKVLAHPIGYVSDALEWTLYVLWAAFAIDYVVRLTLADQRPRWFVRHILDLAIVVLPFLRPFRLLRLVVVVAALQKAFGDAIRGRVVIYTAASAVLLVYAASLAVLDAERSDPSAHIRNFGDAVWWSITTITTVGYGDFYPVTAMGRLVAVLLMIGGISLIGMITATVATWIVQNVAEQDSTRQAATAAQIEDLHSQITQLTTLVAANLKQEAGGPYVGSDGHPSSRAGHSNRSAPQNE
jgi:voltage-gated potassium channel